MAKFDTSEEYDLQIEQFEKTDPVHAFLFNSKFAKLIRSIAYLKKQLETIPPAVSVKGSAESTYRTGEVNISPSNIGLGRVNNTADTEKPVSTAQQAAINAAVSKTLSLGETASTAYAGSKGKALADAMGVLSGLTTSAKNTIVAAINELNTKLTATSSGQLITVSNDYYDLVLSTTEGHWYIQNNICFALVSLECKTPSDSKWVTVAKLPKNCKYPKNLISSVKSGSSKYVKSLFLQPVGSEIWVQGGDAGAWYWVSITFPV